MFFDLCRGSGYMEVSENHGSLLEIYRFRV